MGLDHDRTAIRGRGRARTEAVRSPTVVPSQPSLQPPPSLKASQRERSSSFGTTFVSTAVLPAPASTEILSSLISSLTVLSDTARDKSHRDQEPEPTIRDFPTEFLTHDSFILDDSDNDTGQRDPFLLDASDDEVAEAPVIGFARSAPTPAKKSTRGRWAAHLTGRTNSISSLNGRSSSLAYRAPSTTTGVGIPSIERPPSSLATSLPANASRPSLDQSIRGSIKMLFPGRSTDDSSTAASSRAPTIRDDDARSTTTTRSRRSARRLREISRNIQTPDPVPLPVMKEVSPIEKRLPKPPHSKTYNPLDPANREDLSENLIPLRRSSSRNSPTRNNSIRPGSSRTAGSSRDLQPAITEEDVIEEEDPTLRRIKELQRAREKRQIDWEKENREKEKSPIRLSPIDAKIANGNEPSKTSVFTKSRPSTRQSVEEHLPSMSATISGQELGMLPAFNGDKASPSLSPSTPTTPFANIPHVTSRTDSRMQSAAPPPSPIKHRRRFSGSLRRSGSSRRGTPADAKMVGVEVDAYLGAPRLSQKLRHPRTGRMITFSEVGDPDGFVVFVCAGMGITRYITVYYDEIAKAQKLRLLTPDRPGTGDSEPLPDAVNPAMAWADDVMAICQSLQIYHFSLLAHSAGSIYALATALKMPQYVKGRIHLLAPWIPPSQMTAAGPGDLRAAVLPTSHKILSRLPTGILKAANARFLSAASAGMDGRSKGRRDKNLAAAYEALVAEMAPEYSEPVPTPGSTPGRASSMSRRNASTTSQLTSPPQSPSKFTNGQSRPPVAGIRNRMFSPTPAEQLTPEARQALYNMTLTDRIWEMATLNANPIADLIVCFERRRTIGFSYADVTRNIIIHHGREDSRVPLANVQWLASIMPRCELRVLDKESHSLMGSAIVMSNLLTEIGKEWADWDVINKENLRRRKILEAEQAAKLKEERHRFIRTGRY